MKVELIKYFDQVDGRTWWKIEKDGRYISVYPDEQSGITAFDNFVNILQEPRTEPEIIKSITL